MSEDQSENEQGELDQKEASAITPGRKPSVKSNRLSILFKRWILGHKNQSSTDSNRRRYLSRVSVVALVVMFALGFAPPWDECKLLQEVASVLFLCWALAYFIFVVATIPFLTTQTFTPNPVRLFLDGTISSLQMIIFCAQSFSLRGLNAPSGYTDITWPDYIYFSTVTFTTLGYGDFSPKQDARLVAAAEAFLGNMHLGILVAAAFLAVSVNNRHERPAEPTKPIEPPTAP